MAGNWFSNAVSGFGKAIGAPVIFDWDTDAAREDYANQATTWAPDTIKRQDSSAAAQGIRNDQSIINAINAEVRGGQQPQQPQQQQSQLSPYDGGGSYGSYGAAGGGSGYSQADMAFLDDQANQLRDLLGRTDVGLNQGLTRNNDEYNTQVGQANNSRDQQLAAYGDQRVQQNRGKLDSYNTVNKNAGNGYRSLAQLIGRASGTGSSAFRELLPDVVGKDISSKRQDITDTYGQNLQGIDKAEKQYGLSFESVLADLMKQKRDNENNLRSGIEGQRQGINAQLAQTEGQKAQARGGNYAAVKAAQQPFQQAINSSRDQVQNFFDQYRTPYTARQAVAAAPELSQYQIDRSNVNAQAQPGVDPNNPYASLLRRRQQEQA